MKGNFEISKGVEGVTPCVKVNTVDNNRKISKTKKKSSHHVSKSVGGLESKFDGDKAEINAYIRKLQELVPFMPKDKRLSKAEVISNVIDYIHDLRETLGLPPCQNGSRNGLYESCTKYDDDYWTMSVSSTGTTVAPLSDIPSNVHSFPNNRPRQSCSMSNNSSNNRQPFVSS